MAPKKEIAKQKKILQALDEKEIQAQIAIALAEIGEILPWYNPEVKAWIFEHPLYPVSYSGKTSAEVIKSYPLYIREFIVQRLQNNLAPFVEKQTKGHGGKRTNAGRPTGSIKETTIQIRVPEDIAKWLKMPGVIPQVRSIMRAYKQM